MLHFGTFMFESVASDPTVVRQGRARFYGTLPASLLFHGMVVVAWLIGESWEIEFPSYYPRLIAPYSLAEAPPPPKHGKPRGKKRAEQARAEMKPQMTLF